MDCTAKLFTSCLRGKRGGEGEEEEEKEKREEGKREGRRGKEEEGKREGKKEMRERKEMDKGHTRPSQSRGGGGGGCPNSLKPPTMPHLLKSVPPPSNAKLEPSLQHMCL